MRWKRMGSPRPPRVPNDIRGRRRTTRHKPETRTRVMTVRQRGTTKSQDTTLFDASCLKSQHLVCLWYRGVDGRTLGTWWTTAREDVEEQKGNLPEVRVLADRTASPQPALCRLQYLRCLPSALRQCHAHPPDPRPTCVQVSLPVTGVKRCMLADAGMARQHRTTTASGKNIESTSAIRYSDARIAQMVPCWSTRLSASVTPGVTPVADGCRH
ncbi:hypothetical protein B0T20DRAFT_136846 [Sordaria brevicollis]|uniref:Uncharacterized protein n=1 Tax=Sordaria brevicollis TaxID=83679 RepID=A0AAE0PM94_SORBR|nr:hypothetical protein B0T20DRAFT_136846 [Sordaria brevicollis]